MNILGALYWCTSPSLIVPSAALGVRGVAGGRREDDC